MDTMIIARESLPDRDAAVAQVKTLLEQADLPDPPTVMAKLARAVNGCQKTEIHLVVIVEPKDPAKVASRIEEVRAARAEVRRAREASGRPWQIPDARFVVVTDNASAAAALPEGVETFAVGDEAGIVRAFRNVKRRFDEVTRDRRPLTPASK